MESEGTGPGNGGLVDIIIQETFNHDVLRPVGQLAGQVMKFLGVFSCIPSILAYGLDLVPSFAVGQGVFKAFLECCHETIEVLQFQGIIFMEGDHTLCYSPF